MHGTSSSGSPSKLSADGGGGGLMVHDALAAQIAALQQALDMNHRISECLRDGTLANATEAVPEEEEEATCPLEAPRARTTPAAAGPARTPADLLERVQTYSFANTDSSPERSPGIARGGDGFTRLREPLLGVAPRRGTWTPQVSPDSGSSNGQPGESLSVSRTFLNQLPTMASTSPSPLDLTSERRAFKLQVGCQDRGPRRAHFHNLKSAVRGRDDGRRSAAATAQGDRPPTFTEKSYSNKSEASRKFNDQASKVFATHEDFRKGLLKTTSSEVEPRESSMYLSTGVAQAVVQNSWFKDLTTVMIIISVIWLAIDTDYNKADLLCDAPPVFIIVNNIFCAFFFLEAVLRFCASRSTREILSDAQYLFDLFLVVMLMWDTWIEVALYLYFGYSKPDKAARGGSILRVFRIFRISRVARLGRLLRIIPELMVLIKGMMIAMRSVFATLLLLILAIYVFAIAFTTLLSTTPVGQEIFPTVPGSINFLLIQVVCGFNEDYVSKLLRQGLGYYLLFLSYIFFASLTIMNMLIGVICQVVGEVADVESEAVVLKGLNKLLENMKQHLDIFGNLPPERFAELMTDEGVTDRLVDLGVDIEALINEVCHAYRDREKLSAQHLQEIVLSFRRCSSKNVTMKDIMSVRTFMSDELAALEARLCRDMQINVLQNEGTAQQIDTLRALKENLQEAVSPKSSSQDY